MTDQGLGRRDFLKTAVAGGAAAAATATAIPAPSAQAQQPAAPPAAEGYEFLNLDEAAFVEALVDHMVPADELTPKGTEIGINIYIDRALAGAWGKASGTRSSIACTASDRPSTAFLAARLARWLITATRGRSGIAASRGRRKPSTSSSPNPRRRCLPTACLTRECRTRLIVPI